MIRTTFVLLLISICSFGQVLKQPVGQMQYAEFNDPACVSCPIIVFLHGSGEGGTDINLVYKHGLPKLLKASSKKYITGFRVIVPQMPAGNWLGKVEDRKIIKYLKWVRANIPNDSNIFLTGLSMGGLGAWQTTYDLESKGLVRGIAPVSASSSYPGAKITADRKIPVWAIHGDADTAIPIASGIAPINAMNVVKANPAPIFTIIKGGSHSSSTWDVAYSLTPRAELGNTTIYEWMLKQCIFKKSGIYIDGVYMGESPILFQGHTVEFKN